MAKGEHWYVLRVRTGFEEVVAHKLRKQSLEVFLPERQPTHIRKASHRKSLLPGYVFCRFALKNQQSVVAVSGVLCIMGIPKPTPFDDKALYNLQAAIGSGLTMKVLRFTRDEKQVLVLDGPLQGLTGSLSERNGRRYFAIHVEIVERTLAFEWKDWSFHSVPARSSRQPTSKRRNLHRLKRRKKT